MVSACKMIKTPSLVSWGCTGCHISLGLPNVFTLDQSETSSSQTKSVSDSCCFQKTSSRTFPRSSLSSIFTNFFPLMPFNFSMSSQNGMPNCDMRTYKWTPAPPNTRMNGVGWVALVKEKDYCVFLNMRNFLFVLHISFSALLPHVVCNECLAPSNFICSL